MIKLTRLAPPIELNPDTIKSLTEEYIEKGTSVWKKNYIKEKLLLMSSNKCAYCEAPLNLNGTYMEVEHFFSKSIYPEKVVDWENLLPSCKTCNTRKRNLDPNIEPIINPTIDNPKEHLGLKRCRIVGCDDLGKNTITVLKLNDWSRLALNRLCVIDAMTNKIESLSLAVKRLPSKISQTNILEIKNTIEDLLITVQPDQNYSAILSTVLLSDPEYKKVKLFLIENNHWDAEITMLEESAKRVALNDIV